MKVMDGISVSCTWAGATVLDAHLHSTTTAMTALALAATSTTTMVIAMTEPSVATAMVLARSCSWCRPSGGECVAGGLHDGITVALDEWFLPFKDHYSLLGRHCHL